MEFCGVPLEAVPLPLSISSCLSVYLYLSLYVSLSVFVSVYLWNLMKGGNDAGVPGCQVYRQSLHGAPAFRIDVLVSARTTLCREPFPCIKIATGYSGKRLKISAFLLLSFTRQAQHKKKEELQR